MAAAPTTEPIATRAAATLPFIDHLRLRFRFLLSPAARGGRGLLRRLLLAAQPEAGLQVVEDEACSGVSPGDCGDEPIAVGDDEDAAFVEGDLDLRRLTGFSGRRLEKLAGLGRDRLRPRIVAERRGENGSARVRQDGRLDLRGDLDEIGESLRGIHSGQT